MASKLNLDQNKVDRARAAARTVALDTQAFIDRLLSDVKEFK